MAPTKGKKLGRPFAGLIAAVLALGLLTGAAWADGDPDHCGPGETLWFNAALAASGKIVSLCGSPTLEGASAWLDYRFGPPGAIERQYPEARAGSLSAFTYRRYTRPRVTYLKFDFTDSGITYAILESYDAEGATPLSAAHLRTTRSVDGSVLTDDALALSSEPLGLMQLEDKVTTEPYDE